MPPRQVRDVLAVVGSTSFVCVYALARARVLIEQTVDARRPDLLISGGAAGIDALAAEIARRRGIAVREFTPENPRWRPAGYADRNQRIADTCTRILRITCRWSRTYGSGWTVDRATEQGKPVLWRRLPEVVDDGQILLPATGDSAQVSLPVAGGSVADLPVLANYTGWCGRDASTVIAELVRAKRRVRWVPADPGF